jgi:hypothetical protein
MNLSLIQIFSVTAMVVVTFVLIFAYRSYLAANSERRMLSMIESIGLDPAIASSSDLETIMGEVRKRCRNCTSEDVCERWLTCSEKDDNDFCPNAKAFTVLKKNS